MTQKPKSSTEYNNNSYAVQPILSNNASKSTFLILPYLINYLL